MTRSRGIRRRRLSPVTCHPERRHAARGLCGPCNSRRVHAFRRALIDAIKAGPCVDCGGTFPPECMDFDHRPGQPKLRGIARMWTSAWSLVLAEIAKCDLVCANCHRIRTRLRALGGTA